MCTLLIWFLAAATAGYLFVLLIRTIALKKQWLDVPNERSLHHCPTPRLGGIGVLLSLLLGLACLVVSTRISLPEPMKWMLFPSLLVACVSLVDDLRGLSRGIRLIGHIAGATFVLWIFRNSWMGQPLPLLGSMLPTAICGIFLFLWLVGLTNAYNFMDGIDGIAALQGLVALAGWNSVLLLPEGLFREYSGDLILLVLLSGSLFGFLLHNWAPAGIFFGDTGSTCLGFFLASMPFVATAQGLPFERAIEAGVLFVWPFVSDASMTFGRRLILREPVFRPHRTHLYQKLAASFTCRKTGHRITSLVYGLLALVGIGLYWTTGPLWAKLAVLTCLWAAVYLWIVYLRPSPEDSGSRNPFQSGFDIFLAPPDISEAERLQVSKALDSGYIAPVGPQVNAFEQKLSDYLQLEAIQAVNSGTAAIHIGLRVLGIGPGDHVLCPDLTFIASVNPVRYLGAHPCLVDVDPHTWAMDVEQARLAVRQLKEEGACVRALIAVHAYGIPAPMDELMELAASEDLLVLEDCAGALGTTIGDRHVGCHGDAAILSFNGNKVLTTSGGGALYVKDPSLRPLARSLANQGKGQGVVDYRHEFMGYNYRLSNVCAAIGLGQFTTLDVRLERKQQIYDAYKAGLADLDGIAFMPEPAYGRANHWLTCIGTDSAARTKGILNALRSERIEAVATWQPMHEQWANAELRFFGGKVSKHIATHFLSLPSGSQLTDQNISTICRIIRSVC